MAFSSAKLRTLGELLTDFHFHIPDYQRGYSWGKHQLEALWSDLRVAESLPGKLHFTGIVLLKPMGKPSGVHLAVELVDGQQRVISAMLLVKALMSRIAQKTPAFRMTFDGNGELQDYFDYWALADNSKASRLLPDCSSYASNLDFAGKFFASMVHALPDIDTAQRYLHTLLQHFSLFILDVQPEFDIHVAFETLNNRGKQLSHLELLKNRLIYLSNVLPTAPSTKVSREALRKNIHDAWKGIYKSLGRSAVTQNHDDEFLSAHSIAYFGEVKEADWLEKVLLTQTFSVTNPDLSLAFIQTYICHLEQAAVWWSHLHDSRYMPKAHQLQLARIARVTYSFFKPLLLAAYMRGSAVNPDALGKPGEHSQLLAPTLHLLVQVERFIVVVQTLAGRPGHLGRADMNRLARALMRPDVHDSDWFTSQGLDQNAYPGSIAFAAEYVQACTDNRDEAGIWTYPRFQWEGYYSSADVAQAAANRLRKGTGYYKWAFTRVVLLEYEEARRHGGNQPVKLKYDWDEFKFDDSVEHIYPQNADKVEYWTRVIPIHGRAKALKNAVVHSLGNLLLLSTKDNSTVSTLAFTTKKGESKRAAFIKGSHSATEIANLFAARDWNAAAIAARGIAMLKFAEKRWSFSLTDTPENYASYLPMLFGEKAEDLRSGAASGGASITNKTLNPIVKALLE